MGNFDLTISNGDLTVNFDPATGTGHKVEKGTWAPAVSWSLDSVLSGKSHADVIDKMSITIQGATPADVLQKIDNLNYLIEYAEEWSRGNRETPVVISYRPNGSQFSAWPQSVILGRAQRDAPAVTLPSHFESGIQYGCIAKVTLSFARRGLWLGAAETAPASAAKSNPYVGSTTFPTNLIRKTPMNARISFPNISGGFAGPEMPGDMTILTARDANNMVVVVPGSSSGVPSGNNALNGYVWRFTASDHYAGGLGYGVVKYSDDTPAWSINSDLRRFAIYAALRAPSSGPNWSLTPQLGGDSGDFFSAPEPFIYAGNATNTPEIQFLGYVSTTRSAKGIGVRIVSDQSTSDNIEINYLVIQGLDETANAVKVFQADLPGIIGIGGGDPYIDFSHGLLSSLRPSVQYSSSSASNLAVANYRGNAALQSVGNKFAFCVLGTSGANWRLVNTDSTILNYRITPTRNRAFLTPR